MSKKETTMILPVHKAPVPANSQYREYQYALFIFTLLFLTTRLRTRDFYGVVYSEQCDSEQMFLNSFFSCSVPFFISITEIRGYESVIKYYIICSRFVCAIVDSGNLELII